MRQTHDQTETLQVDPMVLRQASQVLFDAESGLYACASQLVADTVTAAHAFDGWRTGPRLTALGESWKQQLDTIATVSGQLCHSLASAESRYRAADAKAHTAITTVDDHYLRGR